MIVALVAIVAACAEAPPAPPAEPVWPTEVWARSAPEAQGVDSDALAALVDDLAIGDLGAHSLHIVRGGQMILAAHFYPYDGAALHDVASVTKSVMALIVGAAIEAGVLESAETTLGDLAPQTATGAIAEARLDQVLAMRSGLACGQGPGEPEVAQMARSENWAAYVAQLPAAAAPGAQFAYCSPAYHAAGAALAAHAGEPLDELAERLLFAPLGVRRGDWPRDPQGVVHGWGDLRLAPGDLAKLGLLMLHSGRWGEQRIVSSDYMASVLQPRGRVSAGGDGYGLGWWLPQRGPLAGGFEARGRGGQRIVVLPAEDLIVVTTGAGFEPADALPGLQAAIRGRRPLPANPEAAARLNAALKRAAAGPAETRAPAPADGRVVSGLELVVPSNPIGLQRIGLDFSVGEDAILTLALGDALGPQASGIYRLPVGLGKRYRITESGPRGYAVAARGAWTRAGEFDIEYAEVSGPNRLRFRLDYCGGPARLEVADASGLVGDVSLQAALPALTGDVRDDLARLCSTRTGDTES